jgi:hypothetical protein
VIVGIALYGNSADELSYKILAIKTAFTSALIDANVFNLIPYFFTRQNFSASAVFGRCEVENAHVISLLPFSIRLFAHVTDVSCNHVCTLKESRCFWLADRAIGREALGFRVALIVSKLHQQEKRPILFYPQETPLHG